jgi:hypothetical protein
LRLKPATFLLAPLLLLGAGNLRAEYVVLRSGQRLHVTGYQLLGDKYRLQMPGGWVDAAVQDVVRIEPEDTFAPVPPQAPVAGNSVNELVAAAASRYGVDAGLITSVIAVESNFDPKAVSPKNARGLMQLLPETAARFGVKDAFDPKENIEAGTQYLRELLDTYHNDVTLALAAYNAGPVRVQQYGTVPPFRETVSYVRRVKRTYANSKSMPAANTTKPTSPIPATATPLPPPGPNPATAPPSAPPATPPLPSSSTPPPSAVPPNPSAPPNPQ